MTLSPIVAFPEKPCTEGVYVHDEDLQRYCAHDFLLCRVCGRHTEERPFPERGDCLGSWCPVHGRVAWSCP
jgi:hypothetical protein